MTYEKLRQQFTRPSFRKKLKDKLGEVCVNCGSDKHIEYHHIVPLKNGGTNKLSNIVPICESCHYKAHDRSGFKNKNGGRPRKISFEDAEPILEKYFDVKIGAKETKKLLGISQKSQNTWSDLLNEYKEKHNINEFYNRIDLYESQDKRVKTLKNNKYN